MSTTGAGGSTGSATLACTPVEALVESYWAAVADAEGRCLETELRLNVDLCEGAETIEPVYLCFQSIADGRMVWIYKSVEVRLGDAWRKCPEDLLPEGEPLPPPCFAVDCPVPPAPVSQDHPASTCTEALTREEFDCGGAQSPWDEGCCRRPPCVGGACDPGMACRTIAPYAFQYCWTSDPERDCDCGGLPGGADIQVCFPA